jgi:hypothetical protein
VRVLDPVEDELLLDLSADDRGSPFQVVEREWRDCRVGHPAGVRPYNDRVATRPTIE